MKKTIITSTHFLNSVLIFCSLLLINIACEKKDAPAVENSSPSKQIDGKVSTKKDDSLINTTKSSNVVVEVNGITLTQGEIDTEMSSTLESIKGRVPQDQMENVKLNIRKKNIEDFITRIVLIHEADKQKIVASDNEIKQEISKIEKRLPEGVTLETRLKQRGVSMEELNENITFSLRVNKLLESQIKDDLTPSDEEIRKHYTNKKEQFGTPETVHARHILIKVDDKDDEKTKGEKMAKIETLRKQLIEGADFEKLAKEHSDCPSGEKGGDLGTFARGSMVKPFEDAVFSQKVNEIGLVVTTRFGYHLIQVLEHNKATQKTLNEAKDNIRDTLKNQKKQEMITSYIAELKEKAKIVYGITDDSKN
jgi:peptidyl-prolyl cis-trans isomerase C